MNPQATKRPVGPLGQNNPALFLTAKNGFTRTLTLVTSIAIAALVLSACGGGGDDPPAASPAPGTPPPITQNPPAPLPTCTAAVPANAPLQSIAAVQGSGSVSPLASSTVTVRGVVVGDFQNTTATRLNGFFIQQTDAADDPLASKGIFVFAPGAAKVANGDLLQVSGLVTEFGGTADSVTQIAGSVTFSVCGSGLAVAPTVVSLPVANAQALERYEGMLVEFNQPLAVTELFELGRFGSLALSTGGRQFHPNNGNVVVTNAQNLLNRVVLDDGSSAQNPNPTPFMSAAGAAGTRRMGDTTQKVTGVLSHGFNAYRIHPTVAPVFVNANPRQTTAPVVGGTLKVASLNVLNYFTTFTDGTNAAGQTGQGCTLGSNPVRASNCRGADSLIEFQRQQAKIVEAIVGLDADVVGLIEIQNTDVATLELVKALNAKTGTATYAAVNSGTFGTDAIKVDILYKPAKVNRVGGVVLPTGADLANYTAVSGRPPLAQRFASRSNGGNNGNSNGGSFWFVVNHFKSKGSCPTTGDVDTGQGCFNTGRTQQANALKNFVATLKAQGEEDVLMMGDFNSYLLEDPTKVLESDGSESLLKRMPAADRFTYVFGGETGALDHAYASSSLRQQVSGVGVWHINADEPTALDYNLNFTTDDRFAPTPFRASDHDPVLVGLNLSADAAVVAPVLSATIAPNATVNQQYVVTVTEATPGGSATLAALGVNWGDGTAASSLPGAGTAGHVYTATGTFSVGITLTNSAGQNATLSRTVTVAAPSVPPVTSTGGVDLFFSEYAEGSASNKALEIYNPTTASIDLAAYSVKLYSNGASAASNVLALSGTLGAGQALVLVNGAAITAFQVPGAVVSNGVINFNGDDALTLEKSGAVIDRFGQVGSDPGTEWSANGVGTANRTLRRKAAITAGDTAFAAPFDPSVQWDGFAIDTADNLGIR